MVPNSLIITWTITHVPATGRQAARVQCGIWVCLSSFAYRNTTTSSTTSMMRSKTAMTAMGAMITAGLRGVAITVDSIITCMLNAYK